MTNILLITIIVFLGALAIQKIICWVLRYFKNRYFAAGVQTGANQVMNAIIQKAKEGKSFRLKNQREEIKLIILTKKANPGSNNYG